MGQLIIRQPNGKYALFSTFSDTFVGADFTAEELLSYLREQAADAYERDHQRRMERVEQFGTSCQITKATDPFWRALVDHFMDADPDEEIVPYLGATDEQVAKARVQAAKNLRDLEEKGYCE